MKFSVRVRTSEGQEETRVIEAENRVAVYGIVEQDGSAALDIQEARGGMSLGGLSKVKFGTGVKVEERITFTKNLSAMLNAGLTLSRALSVIERQSRNKHFKEVITSLETQVKGGAAFYEALAQHPKVFSRLFVAMTKAGEESGKLADTLRVVGKQMEASHNLTKKIRGAMIYPAIILFAIAVIAVLMLMFVVPTLSSTFTSLGVELPAATRMIIGISDFMANNVVLVLLGLVGVFVGIGAFFRSKRGGQITLRVARRIPAIGLLVRETYSARAARTLSSLLSSGVEMLTAIAIAAEVVGENIFGVVLSEAEELVRKGEPLSIAFANHQDLYPIFVSEMILVGEETGKVADMLGQVASYYETDVEERTKDLSTIIEPILMLFIGACVGVFALAMIAPIYSLSDAI